VRHILFASLVWLWMAGCVPATSGPAGATATPAVLPGPTVTQALAPPTSDATSGSAHPDLVATVLATPAAQQPDPATYLEDTLAWIQMRALRRDRVDWPSTLAEARAVASGAHTTSDTYMAIRLVLAKLDDRHSVLLEPEQAIEWLRNPGNQDPEARRLEDGIGYVALPGFVAFDEPTATAFATRVQGLIRAVDQPPACGWVSICGRTEAASCGRCWSGSGRS
jgi:hypothetical protein